MTLNGNALGKAAWRVHEYTHVGITVDAYVNISSFSINRMNKATLYSSFSNIQFYILGLFFKDGFVFPSPADTSIAMSKSFGR